jgi:hypothetical protein
MTIYYGSHDLSVTLEICEPYEILNLRANRAIVSLASIEDYLYLLPDIGGRYIHHVT